MALSNIMIHHMDFVGKPKDLKVEGTAPQGGLALEPITVTGTNGLRIHAAYLGLQYAEIEDQASKPSLPAWIKASDVTVTGNTGKTKTLSLFPESSHGNKRGDKMAGIWVLDSTNIKADVIDATPDRNYTVNWDVPVLNHDIVKSVFNIRGIQAIMRIVFAANLTDPV